MLGEQPRTCTSVCADKSVAVCRQVRRHSENCESWHTARTRKAPGSPSHPARACMRLVIASCCAQLARACGLLRAAVARGHAKDENKLDIGRHRLRGAPAVGDRWARPRDQLVRQGAGCQTPSTGAHVRHHVRLHSCFASRMDRGAWGRLAGPDGTILPVKLSTAAALRQMGVSALRGASLVCLPPSLTSHPSLRAAMRRMRTSWTPRPQPGCRGELENSLGI